jgi:hypothetical protein
VEFISLPMASVNSGLPILAANTGGAAFDVQYLEDEGYWKIDTETGKLTDGLYTISLTGEGFQTITDINQVTLLKRVNGGSWFCPGIHIPATGTTSIPTIARSGVSGYSNFGFGSGGNNPLPVELVEFNGMQADQSIQLNWLTASEINAAYFTVERSSDAVSFRALGNVAAHSISNQKREYALIDNSPSIGINYYRLNQFDWNGKNEYSEVIAVNYETLNSSPFIEWVHVDDRQNLSFYTSNNTSEITIRWFDISGRIVNEQSVSASGFIQTNANQHLQNGLYLVQFTDGKNEFVAKIIIK